LRPLPPRLPSRHHDPSAPPVPAGLDIDNFGLDTRSSYNAANEPHLLRTRGATPARGDRQALANLGFVVVTIDGRGTPGRSKSFHDAYYGAMGRDNTIPDQVAGMKELAQR
jgi:hypothetical protein